MTRHATLMDVFGAGLQAASPFLQRETERLKEQNDLQLRNDSARFATDVQSWLQENPYDGDFARYLGRLQGYANEWYGKETAGNASPYYRKNVEAMRQQSMEMLRAHAVAEDGKWRAGQANVRFFTDRNKFIDSNLPPELAWDAISTALGVLEGSRYVGPEEKHLILEESRQALVQKRLAAGMDKVSTDNFRDANGSYKPGDMNTHLENELEKLRKDFDFLRGPIHDEHGIATGTFERDRVFDGQNDWEEKLVEITKRRIQGQKAEEALTDDARYRKLIADWQRTGDSAYYLEAERIAGPYRRDSIAEVMRGTPEDEQLFARNYDRSFHRTLPGLFQEPMPAAAGGRSGGESQEGLNRYMDNMLHELFSGEGRSEHVTAKDVYLNLDVQFLLDRGERYAQNSPELAGILEAVREGMQGGSHDARALRAYTDMFAEGSPQFQDDLDFMRYNFVNRAINLIKNNDKYLEQKVQWDRLQDLNKNSLGLELPNLDKEDLKQIERELRIRSIDIILGHDYWNAGVSALEGRVDNLLQDYIRMHKDASFRMRDTIISGDIDEQQRLKFGYMLQTEELGALAHIGIRGEEIESYRNDALENNLGIYDSFSAGLVGEFIGKDASDLQPGWIPAGRTSRGINTHERTNRRMYTDPDTGKSYRLDIAESGGKYRYSIQERTGTEEWKTVRQPPASQSLPEGLNAGRLLENKIISNRSGGYRWLIRERGTSGFIPDEKAKAALISIMALEPEQRQHFSYSARPNNITAASWNGRKAEAKKDYWNDLFIETERARTGQLALMKAASGGRLPKPADYADRDWDAIGPKNVFWAMRLELAENSPNENIPGLEYSLNELLRGR